MDAAASAAGASREHCNLCFLTENYLPEAAGATGAAAGAAGTAAGAAGAGTAGTAGAAGTAASCPTRTGLACERARKPNRAKKLNIFTAASTVRNWRRKFNIRIYTGKFL